MSTRNPIILLETIHGSHLYGLNRPESDLDFYRVVCNDPALPKEFHSSLRTKQKINGLDDSLEINLTEFLIKANEGVPQALEAMFSPVATGLLEDFRRAYFLNTARMAVTYKRTVMNFARLGVADACAKELLVPTIESEMKKKRVRESVRVTKPRRVERNGMLKYRRHALRLMLNRETGIEFGRFNPRLNEAEKSFVFSNAELEDMKFAALIKLKIDT